MTQNKYPYFPVSPTRTFPIEVGVIFWESKSVSWVMARPPIKGQAWLDKFAEVVNREHKVGMAIVHTDMDLIEYVNWELPEEHRISVETFKDYKSGQRGSDAFLAVFAHLYKRALMEQRDALFSTMSDEPPGAWQKWAWILERKFGDWNLRSVSVDETPKPKQLVLRVKS